VRIRRGRLRVRKDIRKRCGSTIIGIEGKERARMKVGEWV
jgi:hypothetical protein